MCTAHSKGTSQDVPGCWPREASRVHAFDFNTGGGRLLHSLSLERWTDFNPDVYPYFPVPAPIGRVTVSNVTGTGFHVAWTADVALQPTFQLTLTTTRSPAVHLQTQNTSLALRGLEPGVLHLVDIVAKACGQESASAHLRVRTGTGLRRGSRPPVPGAGARRGEGLGGLGSEEQDLLWAAGVRVQLCGNSWLPSNSAGLGQPDRQEVAHFRGRCRGTVGKAALQPQTARPLPTASSWVCGRETLGVQACCASPSLSLDRGLAFRKAMESWTHS